MASYVYLQELLLNMNFAIKWSNYVLSETFKFFNLDRKHELLREFQEVNHQISGAKRSHASLNVVKSWQFKQLGWIAEYKHGALKVDFLVFCFNRGQQWWYADRGRSAKRDLHPFLGMPFVGSHEIFKWDINIRVKHIIHIYIYSSIYPIYPFFSPHLGKAVLLIACCQTSSAVLFCHLAIAWHFCASTPQWHWRTWHKPPVGSPKISLAQGAQSDASSLSTCKQIPKDFGKGYFLDFRIFEYVFKMRNQENIYFVEVPEFPAMFDDEGYLLNSHQYPYGFPWSISSTQYIPVI